MRLHIKKRKYIKGDSAVSRAMNAELQRQQDKDTRYYNDNGTYTADTELLNTTVTAKRKTNNSDRWDEVAQEWVHSPGEDWEWDPIERKFVDNTQPLEHKRRETFNEKVNNVPYTAVNESTRVTPPVIKDKLEYDDFNENAWETDLYGEANYPNHMDLRTKEFFDTDVIPRFKREHPDATDEELLALYNVYNIPFNYYYNRNSGVGGYNSGAKDSYLQFYSFGIPTLKEEYPNLVTFNTAFSVSRPVVIHELTHGYRQGELGNVEGSQFANDGEVYRATRPSLKDLGTGWSANYSTYSGYNERERDLLNSAYNLDGFELKYNPLWEKGTTNTESRYRIWSKWREEHNDLIPTLEELDDYIDNLYKSGYTIENIIRDSNAYGQQMYENGLNRNILNALKYVAYNKNTPQTQVPVAKFGRRIKFKNK